MKPTYLVALVVVPMVLGVDVPSSHAIADGLAADVQSPGYVPPTLAVSDGHPILETLPAAFAGDCGACGNCENPARHRLFDGDPNWDRRHFEPDHDCISIWGMGECQDRHEETQNCKTQTVASLDRAAREILWGLARDGSPEALARSVLAAGNAVTYNSTRKSVQAFACDGASVILNIPLSDAQVAAVESLGSE